MTTVKEDFTAYINSLDDARKIGREYRKDGLLVLAELAVSKYVEDVRNKVFPGEEYSYPITDDEWERVLKSEYLK